MKIIIETIPHKEQRYETVGDWQWIKQHEYRAANIWNAEQHCTHCTGTLRENESIGGECPDAPPTLNIRVSQMSELRYEWLIAVHELVEALLCEKAGITPADVDEFDFAWQRIQAPGEVTEPGNDPIAPYHRQHRFASIVEELMAMELGVDWSSYSSEVNSL
jgi:hypothetical protein